MVHKSLAGVPLSSNDISSLTKLFTVGLGYYQDHCSPFEKDYLKKLSAIMGLGFTAILMDGDLLTIHQSHLMTFIRYLEDDDKKNWSALAYPLANIINGAVFVFQFEKPAFYSIFQQIVKEVLTHITLQEAGETKEANRLLKLLFHME